MRNRKLHLNILAGMVLLTSVALVATMSSATSTTAPATAPFMGRQLSPHEIVLPARGYIALPMHLERGLPVVTLHYDGRPHRFLLDTGAAMVVFRRARDLPSKHRNAPKWDKPMRDGAGVTNKSSTTMKRIDEWSIGTGAAAERIDFLDFEAAQLNLPVFSQFPNVSGLIGRELFADCAITLDYEGGRLIVHRSAAGTTRRASDPRKVSDPRKLRDPPDAAIPMQADADGWRVDVALAGRTRTLQIDTCAMVSLWMSERATANLPLTSEESKTRVNTALSGTDARITKLTGDLTIGDYSIHEPTILIHGPETDHDLLGSEILQRFMVTFDPPAKRMTFRRA